jgi:hypothetical protein
MTSQSRCGGSLDAMCNPAFSMYSDVYGPEVSCALPLFLRVDGL